MALDGAGYSASQFKWLLKPKQQLELQSYQV